MSQISKDNNIAIAKALGIILMVVGHSGCPQMLSRFLYTFHMPLFFFCSGYFFKEIYDRQSLFLFCKKRIRGLYVPYIKWSLLFIFLHNVFFRLNILNELTSSYRYGIKDYAISVVKALLMSDYELLIRPFWFIKVLLIASILMAIISYLFNKLLRQPITKKSEHFMDLTNLLLLLFVSILLKYFNWDVAVVGNLSVVTFSMVYIYLGKVFRFLEWKFSYHQTSTIIITFIICLIGCNFIEGPIDMRYTTLWSILPYFMVSICGILFTIFASKILNGLSVNRFFYYIGNNTMPILALNMLALKLGNLIKILLLDLPIKQLSDYPIISEYNDYFWLLYTLIGVSVPLITYKLYEVIKRTIVVGNVDQPI